MSEHLHRPGLFRHLMIILYDLLLLLSVLFLASVFAVIANRGEAISAHNPFFFLYLLMVSLFFYGWFWTHGGQTLGMRAWKVTLVSTTHQQVSWKQAGLRFVGALLSWLCCGLGYAWQWFGKRTQNWPDALSGTRLRLTIIPK